MFLPKLIRYFKSPLNVYNIEVENDISPPQMVLYPSKKKGSILEEGYPVDHQVTINVYSGLRVLQSKNK